MLSCCLKCKENTESKNPRVVNKGRIMVSSNCVVCGSKKSKFIKEQEAKGFLGSTLGKIPILAPF